MAERLPWALSLALRPCASLPLSLLHTRADTPSPPRAWDVFLVWIGQKRHENPSFELLSSHMGLRGQSYFYEARGDNQTRAPRSSASVLCSFGAAGPQLCVGKTPVCPSPSSRGAVRVAECERCCVDFCTNAPEACWWGDQGYLPWTVFKMF